MKTSHRILAFGCHPDDVEFMCGGVLALLARKGCEIHIATMAGGEMGSPTLTPKAIRAQRLKEAAQAATIIGAAFHFAGGYDLEVEYNKEYRQRAVRIMRTVDPSIVFTHPPADYLVDHEETSRLVRNAAYIASVRNYDCGAPINNTARFPHVYYWNAMGLCDHFGHPRSVGMQIDISSVIETKTAMLAAHSSQRRWLSHLNKVDEYIDMMRRQSREEGRRIKVAYAEGFTQFRGFGHPQDNVLKKLLGPLCREIRPNRTTR